MDRTGLSHPIKPQLIETFSRSASVEAPMHDGLIKRRSLPDRNVVHRRGLGMERGRRGVWRVAELRDGHGDVWASRWTLRVSISFATAATWRGKKMRRPVVVAFQEGAYERGTGAVALCNL